MADYSDLRSYGSGASKNERAKEQVRTQLAVQSAQELIQKISDKCFRKCVNHPGSELGSKEQKCLAMCMDRYMEAWNIVSRTYQSRLQKETGGM